MPNEKDESFALENVLDELIASYSSEKEINNLQTYALPNRRAVIQAVRHIKHLLFLGYFSTRHLGQATLRLALSEHLLPATEILSEQIHRATNWEKAEENLTPRPRCRLKAIEFLSRLPALRHELNADILAAFKNDPAAESIEDVVFSYPGIVAITAYRIAHILYHLDVPMLPRIITEFAHEKTGIDIHPGARIGERFFIDHGTGTVIGATCVIGNDVKIYQGVTLGALSIRGETTRTRHAAEQRHPTLEDGVTVYAGTTILGGRTVIGKGATIGGNVWITKSVAPGDKVFYRVNGTQR